MGYHDRETTTQRIETGDLIARQIYATLNSEQVQQIAVHVRRLLHLTDRPKRRDYNTAAHLALFAIRRRNESELLPKDMWGVVVQALDTIKENGPAIVSSDDRASGPNVSQGGPPE